jgi:hypothetical protein
MRVRERSFVLAALTLLAAVALLQSTPAHANYRDCVTGSLLTASCWNPNTVPGAGQSAEVGHASYPNAVTATMTSGTFGPAYLWIAFSGYNGTVNHSGGTIGSTSANYYITVGYGAGLTGTYNLSGTGVINAGNTMEVGYLGTGVFNQTSATTSVTVPTTLYIGNQAGSTGTYNLSAGSLNATGSEYLAAAGTGRFYQSGGTHQGSVQMASSAGSDGLYELTGGTFTGGMNVANAGLGVLNQTAGTANLGSLYVASYTGGSATVNLSGTGVMNTSYLNTGGDGFSVFNQSGGTHTTTYGYLGLAGNTSYNLTGGSHTFTNQFYLDFSSGATSDYNLRGGTLTVNATSGIQNAAGTGTLNIDGGALSITSASGAVNVDTLNLGSAAAYTGSHTLAGAGRSVTAGTMNVGLGGTGTFTQTSGTTTVAGTLAVAANAGAVGTVNLQGGSLTAGLLVNNDTVNFSGGTLGAAIDNNDSLNLFGGGTRALGGALTNNGVVDVAVGTTAEFNGLVDGAGDFTGGGTSVFKGGFSPGNSPALVTIDGDAVFDAGNDLLMELAGLTPGGQFDVLDISGDAWLDGTLDIDLISGFNPAAGNSFDLILADVLHGAFGTVLLPTLDPGLLWNLQYLFNPTGDDVVRLSVESAVVPVPAAAWMLGSGLLALGALRRRRLACEPR